jgi:hypothetical protein
VPSCLAHTSLLQLKLLLFAQFSNPQTPEHVSLNPCMSHSLLCNTLHTLPSSRLVALITNIFAGCSGSCL